MDNTWEKLYCKNLHHSIWPWAELISEVKKIRIETNEVLELGCGMGANIPFFLSEGYLYHGVDGSETAINTNSQRFPEIKNNLKVADFTKSIPFGKKFSLIFDRASITHNQSNNIESCIKLISEHTLPNGYFIGIDWFSDKHTDYEKGLILESGTKTDIDSIQFDSTGIVHFFKRQEIINLFQINKFKIIKMDEKIISNCLSKVQYDRASFNFVAIRNV